MAFEKLLLGQQTLYRLVTLDFVQASIGDMAEVVEEMKSSTFPRIIRCIALMNIMSRRLSGQVSRRQGRHGDLLSQARESVRRIALHYKTYALDWRKLQGGGFTDENVQTLAALLAKRMSSARMDAIGADADEVIHDVLITVLDGKLEYSYDMPLPQWLSMQLVRAAWRHSAYPPNRRDGVLLNEAVLKEDYSHLTSFSYEDNPAAWDLRVDLQLRMQKLDAFDRMILHMRLENKDRHEIARALNVTPKTVSNHWTQMLRSMRAD